MKLLITILVFLASAALVAWYNYSQLYIMDSKTTATSGIIFQKTLNLDVYKRISNGNGLLGKYERYSRSDRHDEAITVYCKDFCSK